VRERERERERERDEEECHRVVLISNTLATH
jgi:hypothetical protein